MTEAEWLACANPTTMLNAIRSNSRRKWGLFICACCRRLWSKLIDPRSRRVVAASEQFLDGSVPLDELLNAIAPARAVVSYRIKTKLSGGHRVMEYSPGVVAQCCLEIANNDPNLKQSHNLIASNSDDFPAEWKFQSSALRDIFGNPFRPVTFSPRWRTDTAIALAQQMYESRDFGAIPILADALQDAGCDSDDILDHCRDVNGPHVRGCWVVDLVLDKA